MKEQVSKTFKNMKNLKLIMLSLSLVFLSASMISCGNGNANEATEEKGKEYTSAYVCPMHCDGSGGDAAGTCPVCGMDYVKKDEHEADGHEH